MANNDAQPNLETEDTGADTGTDTGPDADALLASMADEAIDELMSGKTAGDAASDGEPVRLNKDGKPIHRVTKVEAELSPEEAAALAEETSDAAEAPDGGSFADVTEVMGVTSVPTDEELDALLRASPEELKQINQQRDFAAQSRPAVVDPLPEEEPAIDDVVTEDVAEEVAEEVAEDIADDLDADTIETQPVLAEAPVAENTADDSDDALASGDGIVADDALEERTHDVAETLNMGDLDEADQAEPQEEAFVSIAETVAATTKAKKTKKAKKAKQPTVEAKPDKSAKPRKSFGHYLLQPLLWMNAPLADRPVARDAIGKVALVTTLNATAVIAYVLLLR